MTTKAGPMDEALFSANDHGDIWQESRLFGACETVATALEVGPSAPSAPVDGAAEDLTMPS